MFLWPLHGAGKVEESPIGKISSSSISWCISLPHYQEVSVQIRNLRSLKSVPLFFSLFWWISKQSSLNALFCSRGCDPSLATAGGSQHLDNNFPLVVWNIQENKLAGQRVPSEAPENPDFWGIAVTSLFMVNK